MSKQLKSIAYHEAGQITAAVAGGMPIRANGLNIDSFGHGCAEYFERVPGDHGSTEQDQQQRKATILALYAAQFSQLKFYPACQRGSWESELAKIAKLTLEMHLKEDDARLIQEDLREQARNLVDHFWPIIDELAKMLLSKTPTPMAPEDMRWGTGGFKRQMSGSEIREFFARHDMPTKIVGDETVRPFVKRRWAGQ